MPTPTTSTGGEVQKRRLSGRNRVIAESGSPEGSNLRYIASLVYIYGVAQKRSNALQLLGKIKRIMAQRYVPAYTVAIWYAGLGKKHAALAWLTRDCEEHSAVSPIRQCRSEAGCFTRGGSLPADIAQSRTQSMNWKYFSALCRHHLALGGNEEFSRNKYSAFSRGTRLGRGLSTILRFLDRGQTGH
jgi:hypothetical protein